jgi:hypothetical protein
MIIFIALLPFLFLVLVITVMLVTQSEQRRRQREYWRSLSPPQERLPESPTCLRCRSAMVRGYLLDRTHGSFGMGTWLEGSPVRTMWPDLVRPRLEQSIPIVSYRCSGCGYLELYARPELVEELDERKPAKYSEL